MIILAAATETMEVITTTTAPTDVLVSYVDITTTTFAPNSQQTPLTTATTTTVVSAPAASTQRQLKVLLITNKDTTNSQTITLQKSVSGTKTVLVPSTLLKAGEVLQYIDGMGFSVLDPFSRPKGVASTTLVNTPGITNPYAVLDSDVVMLLDRILSALKITNVILRSGMSVDIDPDAIRSDFLATQL